MMEADAMKEQKTPEVMRIDVDAVLRQRLPGYYRYIPKALVGWLSRLICQDQLNAMLEEGRGLEGASFCRAVLSHLDVEWKLAPGSRLPSADNSRVLIVSNHPLGGLDGMALIDMVARHWGMEPWFVVNDLLMAIDPLRPVFLPVNKHGRQSREEASAIDEALRSDRPVIIFPAGLVSRRGKGGRIADLEWKKKFIDMATQYSRDILPLHFNGRNSNFFYKFAQWRERLGLRFNFEMVLLPREVFRARGSRFTVTPGDTIPAESPLLQGARRRVAERLRDLVYSLSTAT